MKQEPRITVAEVMTREVRMIDSMASVRDAMKMMRDGGFSSLIVDRRDEHDEYGVCAIIDIAGEVVAKNLSFDRVNVYEIMRKPILTLHPEMDIRYAIRMLNRFRITRAVVEGADRKLQGIVTLRDMVLRYADVRDT